MSRNSSGVYSLPLPAVVPNTLVSSDWANTTLNDMAQAISDSLDRNGRGGMNYPLRFTDGTLAQPAISFVAETTSGLCRMASADVRMAVTGTDVAQFTGAFVSLLKPMARGA